MTVAIIEPEIIDIDSLIVFKCLLSLLSFSSLIQCLSPTIWRGITYNTLSMLAHGGLRDLSNASSMIGQNYWRILILGRCVQAKSWEQTVLLAPDGLLASAE